MREVDVETLVPTKIPKKEATRREEVLAKLRNDIEALAEGVITHSAGAYTARRTFHTIFVNGEVHTEGAPYATCEIPIENRAARSLAAAQNERNSIIGPVDLVWRKLPELTERGDLYMRLCFEPTLREVAKGVWIEERLLQKGFQRG